jgi:hypothetical protein
MCGSSVMLELNISGPPHLAGLAWSSRKLSRALNLTTATLLALFLLCSPARSAQHVRGEMRIEVADPQGAALAVVAELVSKANQVRQTFQIGVDDRYVVQELPFGAYRLSLRAERFAPWSGLVEVLGGSGPHFGDIGPLIGPGRFIRSRGRRSRRPEVYWHG